MRKIVQKFVVKAIIFIVLSVMLVKTYAIIDPLMRSKLNVDLLNGGDEGYTTLKLYRDIIEYLRYFYLLFMVLFFIPDVKRVSKFIKGEKKVEELK